MHPIKALAIGVLAWPAAEIVAFLCVAAMLGFMNAVMMVILTSVAGFLVLRHFGTGARRAEAGTGFFAAQWRDGMAPGLGGVLLLLPGFLTGALGIVVLFPASRRLLLAGFQRLFRERRRSQNPDIIDLAPDEWRPLPDDKQLPPSGSNADK